MTTAPDVESAPAGTGTTQPEPVARQLTVSSAVAYRRDWQLFTDWCTATGHEAMPADADTVKEFLQKVGGAASSARRYRAAIADAHRRAGRPPPETPVAPRAHPFPDVDVAAVLARIPVWGWPAGLFGRRDAMLILARVQAGLTLAQTVGLTVDQIAIDEDRVLHLAELQLPPTEDPRTCPACVWLRWRTMLQHFRRFTPAAVLARRLHRPDATIEHRCAGQIAAPPIRRQLSGPVLVPIDQWGATPLPLLPASVRTITTLTGAHTHGVPPRHAYRTPPPGEPLIAPVAVSAPLAIRREPFDGRTAEQVQAEGLAARRRDHHALEQVTADFEELDAATAQLQARLEELLGQADQHLDRVRDMRRSC